MIRAIVTAIVCIWLNSFMPSQMALALSPEEQLDNPVLEQRARALSAQLRCLVCQNQSIDDSDADLAKDLRREVRTQLVAGKSDEAILNQLQLTYGDYVLLKPPVSWRTYALWLAPVFFILLALWLFILSRRPTAIVQEHRLSEEAAEAPSAPRESASMPKAMMAMILIMIVGSTGVLYMLLGEPDIKAMPLASRTAERQQEQAQNQAEQASLAKALTQAQQQAQANPQSLEAQLNLALAYAKLDVFDKEIIALRRALDLSGEAPSIKAMLAEALSRQAGGQIILPARALIEEILAERPNEPRALFMAGLASYQDELYQQAIAYWLQLADSAPAASPWPALAKQNIAFAAEAGGLEVPPSIAPTIDAETADAISNASEAEQQDMIQSMVAGLEARLEEAPNDEEGWQRLVQARRVLNDDEGLLRALYGYAGAFAQKRDAQLDLLEAIFEFGLSNRHLASAELAVANLKAIDETALEYLFFAGHVAAAQGDNITARQSWEALLSALPKDNALSAQISAQLQALPK